MTNAFLSQNFSKPRTLCGSSRDRRGSGGSSSDSLKAFPLSLFFTDAYFPLTYIHIYIYVYVCVCNSNRVSYFKLGNPSGDKNKSKSRSQQQQRLASTSQLCNRAEQHRQPLDSCNSPRWAPTRTPQSTVSLNGAGNWTIAHLQPCNRAAGQLNSCTYTTAAAFRPPINGGEWAFVSIVI